MTRIFFLVLLSAIVSGCTTYYAPDELREVADRAIKRSGELLKAGKKEEAQMMAGMVHRIDPAYQGLSDLKGLDLDAISVRTAGGINRANRLPVKRSVLTKILLYLPDRVLDLFDIVTVGVNFGPGVYVDAHVTRAAQLALGARMNFGVGWHERRSLGLQYRSDLTANLLPFGTQGSMAFQVGTSGLSMGRESETGLHVPTDPIYQSVYDYWSVGGSFNALIIGAEVDLHLLQIVDFFAGIFGADICNDDFARTRGLAFSFADRELLKELVEINASKKSLRNYAAAKGAKASSDTGSTRTDERGGDTVLEEDDDGFVKQR